MTDPIDRKWFYGSMNVSGNLYQAVDYLNKFHPNWDVVTMECTSMNTVIVYRIIQEEEHD